MPPRRCVLAALYLRGTGNAPRSAMSMNRSVRVSSRVDFTPIRAATTACTLSSGCSSRAFMPGSVLANANAALPVVGLTFIGGLTPNDSRIPANLGLDIRSSLLALDADSKSSLRFCTSARCSTSLSLLSRSTGSVYIRRITSMSCSSCMG